MKPLATLLTLAVTLSCLTSGAHADRKSRLEEKARQERLEQQQEQVVQVLHEENAGKLMDRKQALKDVIASGDAPDEAYWQAGYIKRGDEWVSVQDRWLSPEQEKKLEEYTKARSDSVDSDEGHYKLAQWCAENGFDSQAYAHLKAVLLNNPDHAALRQLLGYQKIGNCWLNSEDYEAATSEADRLAEELRQWGPKVVQIRDGLHSSEIRDQNRAKSQLKEITEAAAVPALELILLPSSDRGAAACVNQLCQINHRVSSVALCKAAMNLPESSASTKQAAIEELKTRPLQDFVPVLLDQLASPITARFRLLAAKPAYFESNQFLLQVVGVSEGRLSHDMTLFNQLVTTQVQTIRTVVRINGGDALANSYSRISQELGAQGHREEVGRLLIDHLKKNEERLVAIDSQRQEQSGKASEILAEVTSLESLQTPEDWWGWWNAQSEIEISEKPGELNEVSEVQFVPFRKYIFRYAGTTCSCFVAGTPVWTDLGPRPIEQLHVGDMALTQDIETGELMYRPIIRTTIRRPKPLVTIDLGAEQITATGGHPFFVPGEGWVRARELKAGQFLHTPTGTIKIDSVTETPDAETYNLVVDGFHTYFVGMSQALVHDVSITSPTDAVVPGLLDR